ncbi:hypothetical protein [Actinomadura miaoliensis]|uniref:WYL domain-containing protein n=1 Tax=Actinomadura miaoliensis TaxID=430685 RepID=A0ABP7WU84_9ACTN
MGLHARHRTRPDSGGRVIGLPAVEETSDRPGDYSPRLELIKPVHGERMEALEVMHALLITDVRLMCTITEDQGYPVLDVYRVRNLRQGVRSKRIRVGLAYADDEWWFVTPGPDGGTRFIAAMRDGVIAARIVRKTLLP